MDIAGWAIQRRPQNIHPISHSKGMGIMIQRYNNIWEQFFYGVQAIWYPCNEK